MSGKPPSTAEAIACTLVLHGETSMEITSADLDRLRASYIVQDARGTNGMGVVRVVAKPDTRQGTLPEKEPRHD